MDQSQTLNTQCSIIIDISTTDEDLQLSDIEMQQIQYMMSNMEYDRGLIKVPYPKELFALSKDFCEMVAEERRFQRKQAFIRQVGLNKILENLVMLQEGTADSLNFVTMTKQHLQIVVEAIEYFSNMLAAESRNGVVVLEVEKIERLYECMLQLNCSFYEGDDPETLKIQDRYIKIIEKARFAYCQKQYLSSKGN